MEELEEVDGDADADADSTEMQEDKAFHPMERMESEQPGDGIMITTVRRVELTFKHISMTCQYIKDTTNHQK
jgi:hypothetical protein